MNNFKLLNIFEVKKEISTYLQQNKFFLNMLQQIFNNIKKIINFCISLMKYQLILLVWMKIFNKLSRLFIRKIIFKYYIDKQTQPLENITGIFNSGFF